MAYATDISNQADVIDSRDIIERIEELESDEEDGNDPEEPDMDEDDAEELKVLRALAEEGSDYSPDWAHGEALIRDTYFRAYAQEFAEDCGFEFSNDWPQSCIDWDKAARELQMDYTSVDYGGVDYWIRS